MQKNNILQKLQYNSPVILTFALVSAAALLAGMITNFESTRLLFCVYRSPWNDPLSYARLFLNVFGHSGFQHFSNNMLMLLILGPMVEERYGSKNMLLLIAATAFVTGMAQCILFPGSALLGASGIVFMLIFLASLAGMEKNRIPLTLILVAVIYFGQEIYSGIFSPSNVSHLTHILGGCCGIVLGICLRRYTKLPQQRPF